MLVKNKISNTQAELLPSCINQFAKESNQFYDIDSFVLSTITTIAKGVDKKTNNDIWISGDVDVYCLGHIDKDADNKPVYVAYQLWITPKMRSLATVKQIIKFLQFYCQKQKLSRLYILSSRLDCIDAYKRGLGHKFTETTRIFKQEFN